VLRLKPKSRRERVFLNEIWRFEPLNRGIISRASFAKILFPLTLALSPRERELPRPSGEKSEPVGKLQIGKRFSLSPRERVGVKGKEASLDRKWHFANHRFLETV